MASKGSRWGPHGSIPVFVFALVSLLPARGAADLARDVPGSGATDAAIVRQGTTLLRLCGTVGQPAVGTSQSGSGVLKAGFWYGPPCDTCDVVAVPGEGPPTPFALRQSWPNPSFGVSRISFALPERTHVCLRLYDARGRLLTTLLDEVLEGGEHEVVLSSAELASGMYFYRLEAGSRSATRRLLLLK